MQNKAKQRIILDDLRLVMEDIRDMIEALDEGETAWDLKDSGNWQAMYDALERTENFIIFNKEK
jgi:hypothetical protein